MGNQICGTNEKKNKGMKDKRKIQITNPGPLMMHRKQSEAIIEIPNGTERLADLHDNQIGRVAQIKAENRLDSSGMSFLDPEEDRDKVFSFVLYGEDLSHVKNTALFELRNMRDMTMKISRNELLLLTEENADIRNILRAKNIDVRSLKRNLNDDSANSSILNLNPKTNMLPRNNKLDNLENEKLPDYIKIKYNKMVHKSKMEANSNNIEKLIDSTFLLDDELNEKNTMLLNYSSLATKSGQRAEVWDPDVHELMVLEDDKLVITGNREVFEKLEQLANRSRLVVDKTLKSTSACLVFGNTKPKIEDISFKNFDESHFQAAILSLVNFDTLFETNLMRRLIYPQKNGIAMRTPFDIYIVKLHFNGSRRAVLVQQQDLTSFTIHQECYPEIIRKGLRAIFGEINRMRISTIIFRICNWIPETLSVMDVGDAITSYDKLKETFNNGNLLLFFNVPGIMKVKPILGFMDDNKTLKKLVKTTSDDEDDGFVLMDWEQMYSSGKLEYLYINWNPTIYPYRQTLHCYIPIKFKEFNTPFYSNKFDFERNTQVLISVFPHKEPCETRIVIEKHINSLSIKCKIRYHLYHFYNGRMVIKSSALKDLSIKESQEEILSDIIVFDKNTAHENYVLVFELEPENPEEYKHYPIDFSEVVSLYIYSFAQLEIIEMPYKKVDCYAMQNFSYLENTEFLYGIEQQHSPYNPIYKFNCNHTGYYEIRVEGRSDVYYGISIYQHNNYRSSIQQNLAYKTTLETNQGIISLSCKLEIGNYAIQISVERNTREEQEHENENFIMKDRAVKNKIPKHEIKIHFVSYSERLVKSFEEHLPVKDSFTVSELNKKFKVEPIIESSKKMKNKKVMHGSWTSINNVGTNRAKVDCYQKFMKNPGYLIQTDEETKVNFTLKAIKSANDTSIPFISLTILKIDDDFKFKYLLEDENYIQSHEYNVMDINLQPNSMGYLVLCLNLHQDWIGNFELEILSDGKIKTIRDTNKGVLKFNNEQRMLGGFVSGAGGHFNSSSFLFNPTYILTIDPFKDKIAEKIFMELILSDAEHPASIYLFNTNKTSLFDMGSEEIQTPEFNPAFLYEVNSLFKRLKPGQYLVVPSTLNPLEFATNFEFKFSSDERFRITKSTQELFDLRFAFAVQRQTEYNFKFMVTKSTIILFIVKPESANVDVGLNLNNESSNSVVFSQRRKTGDGFIHKMMQVGGQNQVYKWSVLTNILTNMSIEIHVKDKEAIKVIR